MSLNKITNYFQNIKDISHFNNPFPGNKSIEILDSLGDIKEVNGKSFCIVIDHDFSAYGNLHPVLFYNQLIDLRNAVKRLDQKGSSNKYKVFYKTPFHTLNKEKLKISSKEDPDLFQIEQANKNPELYQQFELSQAKKLMPGNHRVCKI